MCGSDETHPYPVRNFTYRNEQVRSDEVQKVIVSITNVYRELVCHRPPPTPCSQAPQYLLSEQLPKRDWHYVVLSQIVHKSWTCGKTTRHPVTHANPLNYGQLPSPP